MGKRKRFQASTALAGMMNRILPKLQEQGWEHHYVTINHGKGPDIYKCGVLTRDIQNPVVENLANDNTEKNIPPTKSSRKSANVNSDKISMTTSNTSNEADSDVSQNTGAKCTTVSDCSVNTQNEAGASNPQYQQLSLFDDFPKPSRKHTFRDSQPTNTQVRETAPHQGSGTLKNAGGEIQYGRKGRPTVNSAPVRVANSVGDIPPSGDDDDKSSSGEVCSVNDRSVTCMSDIGTVQRMRMESPAVTIAIDTEFYCVDGGRLLLTWQFAFSDTDVNIIHECVFYSLDGERLSMETALAWIVEKYGLYKLPFVNQNEKGYLVRNTLRWPVPVNQAGHGKQRVFCKSYQKALETCNDAEYLERLKTSTTVTTNGRNRYHRMSDDDDVGYISDYSDCNGFAIPITLLFHAGIADLPGFGYSDDGSVGILNQVSSISGGVVSLKCFYLHPTLLHNHWAFRPLKCSVRDSMNFAPHKQRALEMLGQAVGVPKLDLPDGYSKDDMHRLLAERPIDFLEYAINDAVVTVCYSSVLWGYNTAMPVTISSGAVRACLPMLMEYFGCDDMDSYNARFRGLKNVNKGLVKNHRKNRKSNFLQYNELVAVDDAADNLIRYAQKSYKGGYNGCFDVGWYDGMTYDYDLKNAYATSMACTFDPDWLNPEGVTYRPLPSGTKLRITDFDTPYDMMFGCFKFEFPESVRFPCIPVTCGSSLIYPRRFVGSRDSEGVYAAGPELYLALKLGATITVVNAVKGIPRKNDDGSFSHSFRSVAKEFVNDRNIAKSVFGEKSLAEMLIKEALNCIYGKDAQGILEKKSWNAFTEQMDLIGGSDITSPVHASVITSGVRACLLAALNELSGLGYKVYSVTTDGFISDAPFDVVQRLNLYDFSEVFTRTRFDLTGDPSMWQMKHSQTSLLNFCTRGNTALNDDSNPVLVDGTPFAGVNAHNGFKTGEELDSAEDRLSMVKTVLSRTGRCHCVDRQFATFREVARREDRKDFYVEEHDRYISMDFDLKRKPVPESFETVYPLVDGTNYEIANFSTRPYENVDEFLRYKSVGENLIRNGCLRTKNDWERFFLKLNGKPTNIRNSHQTRHVSDISWSRIMTVVMGHRLGRWTIPFLAEKGHTLSEKLDFINSFNRSGRTFTETNWKDCRKASRASQMLPVHVVSELLRSMGVVLTVDDKTLDVVVSA